MKLQDYVKYLVCIFTLHLQSFLCDVNIIDQANDASNNVRNERGVIDLVFGKLRTCGSCLCGRANRGFAKFLAGEDSTSHEYPWLAIINNNGNFLNGVLINDRFVLTAASPFVEISLPKIRVTLGQYNRHNHDISSTDYSVESIIKHPEYDPNSHAHDLALIRLSRPTVFEKRVQPVCLPNPGSTYLGQVGTITGWVLTEDGKNTSVPRKLGLPILGSNECIKSGIKVENFHSDSGCIGVLGGKSFTCKEDVGASVLYRSYTDVYDLVGILSDLNDCKIEDNRKSSMYTRVGPHLDWILQNTSNACYCTK
ncbi:phenoloxidase-activating factor 3-like [Prorops nasuta]|uniref:phenoloxidase-activating factor 3-like n=1 Tax=Prorops nasuta TaxID=863751 RepID=UPI0034CDB6DE